MKKSILLILAAISGWIGLGTAGLYEKPASQPPYAVTDVTIVEVEKGTLAPGQTVIVTDNRIDRIFSAKEAKIPEGAKVISGTGLYLMPGLVDAHVHYFDAPVYGRLMIANGILLVRDVGMPNEYILKQRDELNRGQSLGPEMIATGTILDGNPPLISTVSRGIRTPEEGRAAVRQQAASGVNMIKAYSRLDKDVFMAILAEAKTCNLKVAAHLPELVDLEEAASAGLGSSEHFNGFEKMIGRLLGASPRTAFVGQAADAGYLARLGDVKPEELRQAYLRLKTYGLTVCPTVVTFKTATKIQAALAGSRPKSEYVSKSVFDLWKTFWARQTDIPELIWKNWVRMVVDLNKAGVPLMIGTDLMMPGIMPGESVHEEMEIWQEAGLPARDILRSATILPARFMGLGDRLGSIAEGKTASMVLVSGNPLEDIRNTRKIEGVFLRGQYFDRQSLDRLLAEVRDLASASYR